MKLRSTIRAAVLAATLAVIPGVFAASITLHDTVYDGNLNGGEFRATGDFGEFYTFCIEKTEYIYLERTYQAAISGSASSFDPISVGTAYLFEQFVVGGLAGYASTEADHDLNAGLLQQAFWMLEGDQAIDIGNKYIALVYGVYGSVGALANYTGDAVKVLNLTDPQNSDGLGNYYSGNYQRQDVLYYKPPQTPGVPDGGVTLLLLGGALSALGVARRKIS